MLSRGDKFNASGRGLTDHVSVLNLDDPNQDGFYGLRTLDITGGYRSSAGDKVIDVHGGLVGHPLAFLDDQSQTSSRQCR